LGIIDRAVTSAKLNWSGDFSKNKAANEDRYIHGEFGKGMWTFYGGHDPEDYQHLVGDPKTDLNLHPNSPGYRLILNNVLFPAAKKKKQKT
jgi:lysophospholipase L1-like esterase